MPGLVKYLPPLLVSNAAWQPRCLGLLNRLSLSRSDADGGGSDGEYEEEEEEGQGAKRVARVAAREAASARRAVQVFNLCFGLVYMSVLA